MLLICTRCRPLLHVCESRGLLCRDAGVQSSRIIVSYLEAEDLGLDERERATVDLDETAAGL